MPRVMRGKRVMVLVGIVVVLLAGTWIRGNASGIRQAGRVTEALAVGASAARLAHELQRERDLSGYFVASGRRLHYGSMLAQRVWVNQASRSFSNQRGRLEARLGGYDEALGRGLHEVSGRLAGLRLFREQSVDEPSSVLGTAETLRWYDRTVEGLLGLVAGVSSLARDGRLAEDLRAVVALTRYKEAVAQERSYLYAAYGGGGFADRSNGGTPGGTAGGEAAASARGREGATGGIQQTSAPRAVTATPLRDLPFSGFASAVGRKATSLAEFQRVASPQWRERLSAARGGNADIAKAEATLAAVNRDPAAAASASQKAVKDWFFDMNSQVDTLRRLENQLFADVTGLADATSNGSYLW